MNKQITEDYVSFEIAQLLKEKGFDESCDFVYDGNKLEWIYRKFIFLDSKISTNSEFRDSEIISATTHQMALKWLREVHGFIVTIDYDRYPVDNGESSIVGYGYNIQTKDNPEDYYRMSESVYDSYEEAVEAALKYTLENLI